MATTTVLTLADYLALPEEDTKYELSHGELVRLPLTMLPHDKVKNSIFISLLRYLDKRPVGNVVMEGPFEIEDSVRRPDIAFVNADVMASLPKEARVYPFPPDIAIEVISKSETVGYMHNRVKDYFEGGVTEVWQIFPDEQEAAVRTLAGLGEYLRQDQRSRPPSCPASRSR